jgi:predicted ABC-type ATPase
MTAPRAIIIGGPNGAGKTTFAREFLPAEANCRTFINADLIAEGLSPFRPESMVVEASRLMLERIRKVVAKHDDFAIETTLAGRAYLGMIHKWKAVGYQVQLIFLQLPSADLAVERVRQRVAQGGHNIPEPDIRRRFDRGSENLRTHYRGAVDTWQVFDTSQWPPVVLERQTEPTIGRRKAEGSRTAMMRAAQRAAILAKQHDQPLLLWRDGQVIRIMPHELAGLPGQTAQG